VGSAAAGSRGRRGERGVVLALVLVLAVLLIAGVTTYVSRAVIEVSIVDNRNRASQAEALARGGVQVAMAMIAADGALAAQGQGNQAQSALGRSRREQRSAGALGPPVDLCASLAELELPTPEDAELEVTCADTGSKLNINAIRFKETGEPDSDAEEFLVAFFEKIIGELGLPPGETELYDARELAQNLLDFVDPNDDRVSTGGWENDYYERQDPPYKAWNQPLLSVEQLGLVEGFDAKLVAALKPYLTVFPLSDAQGINLNTAPPHVLGVVYHGNNTKRMNDQDMVAKVLKLREEERLICTNSSAGDDRCVGLSEALIEGSIYPPVELPSVAAAFVVTSTARVGEIERRIEAVIDRSNLAELRLLFWRVQ